MMKKSDVELQQIEQCLHSDQGIRMQENSFPLNSKIAGRELNRIEISIEVCSGV
jgi:predicted transcriptional regulator